MEILATGVVVGSLLVGWLYFFYLRPFISLQGIEESIKQDPLVLELQPDDSGQVTTHFLNRTYRVTHLFHAPSDYGAHGKRTDILYIQFRKHGYSIRLDYKDGVPIQASYGGTRKPFELSAAEKTFFEGVLQTIRGMERASGPRSSGGPSKLVC